LGKVRFTKLENTLKKSYIIIGMSLKLPFWGVLRILQTRFDLRRFSAVFPACLCKGAVYAKKYFLFFERRAFYHGNHILYMG
jgi:hypothetical protein